MDGRRMRIYDSGVTLEQGDRKKVSDLVSDFGRAAQDSHVLQDARGGVDEPILTALFCLIEKGTISPHDLMHIKRLGDMLRDFTFGMHEHVDMTREELKDISLLVDLMREFFLRGNFVELSQAKDHRCAAAAGFLANQVAKIKQTREDDRTGYMGPGRQITPFNLGEPEVQKLFDEVRHFSQEFLTQRGLGKQMGPSGGAKHWKRTAAAREVLFGDIRSLAEISFQRMMQLEEEVWPDRGAEGLYHVKNAIMAADYLSRKGKTLADLVYAVGSEAIIARANEGGDKGFSRSNSMFFYNFDDGEFGVHKKREPIPHSKTGRSQGDRILHYDPDALMPIGLVVEYFKNKKKIS